MLSSGFGNIVGDFDALIQKNEFCFENNII